MKTLRISLITICLLFLLQGASKGDSLFDDFCWISQDTFSSVSNEDPRIGNNNYYWYLFNFSNDRFVGEQGAVRLIDDIDGFGKPSMAVYSADVFKREGAYVKVSVQSRMGSGSGGVYFGVPDPTRTKIIAQVGAAIRNGANGWEFVLYDLDEYGNGSEVVAPLSSVPTFDVINNQGS